MNKQKRETINDFAEKIRGYLDLGYPTDVFKAVELLEGTIVESAFEKEAEIIPDVENNTFSIKIDKSKPESRVRFSIAHELGHLFLHMGFLVDQERWQRAVSYCREGLNEEEFEANEFAAAFLMPKYEFETKLREFDFNLDSMIRHFGVSQPAIINRGRFLGLFTVV